MAKVIEAVKQAHSNVHRLIRTHFQGLSRLSLKDAEVLNWQDFPCVITYEPRYRTIRRTKRFRNDSLQRMPLNPIISRSETFHPLMFLPRFPVFGEIAHANTLKSLRARLSGLKNIAQPFAKMSILVKPPRSRVSARVW